MKTIITLSNNVTTFVKNLNPVVQVILFGLAVTALLLGMNALGADFSDSYTR